MSRKATRIESILGIGIAVIAGTYVGTIATKNVSQEPQEPTHRLLIIDFVETNQPLEV